MGSGLIRKTLCVGLERKNTSGSLGTGSFGLTVADQPTGKIFVNFSQTKAIEINIKLGGSPRGRRPAWPGACIGPC